MTIAVALLASLQLVMDSNPLVIAITGANGHVGTEVVVQALRAGHSVVALDRAVEGNIAPQQRYSYKQLDATDFEASKEAVQGCNAFVHLAAAFNQHDAEGNVVGKNMGEEKVHNTNTTMSYNVLRICAELGINRIAQASSVNTIGMIYSKFPQYDYLPIDEYHPERPEDAYSLSKTICEIQATSIARRYPTMRIASLRFHWVVPHNLVSREQLDRRGGAWKDLWGWVSLSKAAEAVLRALTVPEDQFANGHEAFFICARTTCQQRESVELFRTKYDVVPLKREIRGNQSLIDTSKAERLFGWKEEGFPIDT